MRPKPTWHAEAAALRDAGIATAEIARRLGYTRNAVWKALNPERASALAAKSEARPDRKAAKRAWNKANPRPRKTTRDPDPLIPGLIPLRAREGNAFNIIDFARVDIEDWERLRDLSFSRNGVTGYASTDIDGKRVYLHHLILPIEDLGRGYSGRQCDHINRDRLDNRRSNLRVVTVTEQMRNRGGIFEQAA